ncbi:nucleoside hydrolase [Actinobacteria bacterium YIM 96077]|uniref:Nucleoside hydrolase n=1 Tax=Phytoactinopolyspora halophila TaxID=1981511 RepID=A0A329R3N9_9ACTN|nr:nucleoside hydrolase [Phytoactinopolyspora halophila]AYY13151.1 nucleoside hydrolase [Actinobacteria bacterium YIM 96077]RAW17608.1 nucleoside hydrolase [Phytoactinopolyspora halophila]
MLELLVDTDTGSDDAVALLLAALNEDTELTAVTTVAGNVPVPLATRNALLTLELAGRGQVPVYQGCERPIVRPLHTATAVHGDDGMGDLGLPEPAGSARPGHAIDVLLDRARSRPGELTLVTLGPLTNLAAAVLRDRALLTRFRHVYCMIGAPDAVGNMSATAEFNAWADPEAAHVVAEAAAPELVTWIGWDVSRRDAVMTPDDQHALRELDTPLAKFTQRINRKVAEWAATVTGLDGYDLPDPVAMAGVLRPDLVIETEPAHVRVALGDEARGQTAPDRRLDAPAANVTLIRRVDGKGFKELLFDTLAKRVEDAP